jgi:hypothetical protein
MLNIFDLILPPLYLLIILFIADLIRKSRIKDEPYYKYFIPGLLVKIAGGIALCLIYVFYYGGGDTTNYFYFGADVMRKVFQKDVVGFLKIWLDDTSPENLSIVDSDMGMLYYTRDKHSFFVTRLITPLAMMSFSSIIVCTILLATICYSGVWKLFKTFVNYFPAVEKKIAIAVLFMPSVVFWGSGLLKDTITLSAVGWYLYSFHELIIKKVKPFRNFIYLLVAAFLLLKVKPYILFALLPGSLIWYLTTTLWKIRNFFLKLILTPVLLGILAGSGYLILDSLKDSLGMYALDKVMDRAVVVQQDLKQDYYGGSARFDIGDFDASFSSMIAKAPAAITASLFRPFLWEAKNPVMLLAALENAYILFLTIFLIVKLKIVNIFLLIRKHPLLTFSIVFSLFFAFSVGIATANFGALVRYKIPMIPFYIGSLFILKWYYDSAAVLNEEERLAFFNQKTEREVEDEEGEEEEATAEVVAD